MNLVRLVWLCLIRFIFLNAYFKRSLLNQKAKVRNCQLNDDLAKIFVRCSDDYLLLDVEGAGTPEMANCCHGGCDNCAFSHIFDQLESGKPKWLPLYSQRTLIDGRNHRFIEFVEYINSTNLMSTLLSSL